MMQSATKIPISPTLLKTLVSNAFPRHRMTDFRELTDGYCNRVFHISLENHPAVILKAGPAKDCPMLTYEENLIEREADMLEWAAEKTKVPVPRVFFRDTSRTHLAGHYIFMEALEGVPYNTLKKGFYSRGIPSVEAELGRMLRELNNLHQPEFGYPHAPKAAWSEAVEEMFLWLFDDADRFEISLPISREEFRSLLEPLKPILDHVETACFVHWDLWPGNVMVHPDPVRKKRWCVSGIFDFERVLWGDPLMEYNFGHEYHRSRLCKAYGRFRYFTKEEKIRRTLYDAYHLMVINVEDGPRQYGVPDFHKHFGGLLSRKLSRLEKLMQHSVS